jgi:hypothetical protein
VIAAGAAILGGVMSIFGASQQQKAANQNAQSAADSAAEEKQRAQLNVEQQNRVNAYKEGAQVEAYGGSGVAMTGSPLDEEAAMKIQDNFETQVQEFNGLVSANADTADAAYQQTIGNAEMTAGIANGLSSLSSFLVQTNQGNEGG